METPTTPTTQTSVWISDGTYGERVTLARGQTPEQAATEYLCCLLNAFGQIEYSIWLTVTVWTLDDEGNPNELIGSVSASLDPDEPPCIDGGDHAYREDCDVIGHGGGVIITETCSRCGTQCITDTWATDPATGKQGLESVRYVEAP